MIKLSIEEEESYINAAAHFAAIANAVASTNVAPSAYARLFVAVLHV